VRAQPIDIQSFYRTRCSTWVKELRRANEILRKASAYFAQAELDRQGKW
jgi:transposase-like protein